LTKILDLLKSLIGRGYTLALLKKMGGGEK
jgi:hypothetical protein